MIESYWKVGDVVIGECPCDPSKRVMLRVSSIESDWVYFNCDEYGIREQSCWKERPVELLHEVFRYGFEKYRYKKFESTLIDYEIGDRIKVRGFMFEIQSYKHPDFPLILYPVFNKAEPRQKKINDRLREINKELQDLIREVESND